MTDLDQIASHHQESTHRPGLCLWCGLDWPCDATRLAAAVRDYHEFVSAHDAVEHLIVNHTDDRSAYNAAVDRADRARRALSALHPEATT